jgi:oxalate decarboxylase
MLHAESGALPLALTPPELVQAHLNLDRQTMAALRKDKPIIVK